MNGERLSVGASKLDTVSMSLSERHRADLAGPAAKRRVGDIVERQLEYDVTQANEIATDQLVANATLARSGKA